MIIKDIDYFTPNTPIEIAGYKAEKQMAHYLKREFESNKNIYILNDIRIPLDDNDALQIDHLILHPGGMIVVESKSVSTNIKINEHLEWSRFYNRSWKGMQSPILQANRQLTALLNHLDKQENIKEPIKIFGIRSLQVCTPQNILVAISDSGIIDRPKSIEINEVFKADAIIEKINETIKKQKKETSLTSNLWRKEERVFFKLSENEIKNIINYILEKHQPGKFRKSSIENKIPSIDNSNHNCKTNLPKECKKCKSKNYDVQYGKYGYYLNCLDCGTNTSLNKKCKHCGKQKKIKKEGNIFYEVCAQTEEKEIYYKKE